MSLFRRSKPLHERLAEEAGLDETPGRGLAADAPGWDGEQRGEAGIHGVARARRWDAVTAVEAPGLRGDAVEFTALPDGSLVTESDEPEAALTALAKAIEAQLAPPYRAEAVRRGPDQWAVAASRIAVVDVPDLEGDEVEVIATAEGRELHVDGRRSFGGVPALERLGEAEGQEFVVRGRRLDGTLWEVEATAL
jgi:hypothetical protein